MNKGKIISYLSLILIVFVAAVIGYAVFMSVYPFKTIDYMNVPFPILNDNQTVKAGDFVRFTVNYCRYTDLPSHVERSLENNIIYTLLSSDVKNAQGCKTSISQVMIPLGVAPQKYKLVLTVSWNINIFRTITKTIETQEFNVVE